jgi:hypothetical protein
VEVMETATPTTGEFLGVCAVFVAMVGLWFGLGFHGVRDFGGSHRFACVKGVIRLAETSSTSMSVLIERQKCSLDVTLQT